MSLVCVLSEQVPEEPVVSPYSGAIFEKRLILKYLEEKKVDPICGREMTADELIEIKVPSIIKPKPPSATSIPALLKTLQDEWDAIMLHSFTLRQQLQATRQELTYSLYQHDAACRVIARLSKELTAARDALAKLKPKSISNDTETDQPMTDETTEGLTDVIIEKITQKATVLTAERKKRCKTIPENLVKPEELSKFKTVSSQTGLHSVSHPGIIALDVCPSDSNLLVTGGVDHNVVVFNLKNEQIVTILKGHNKKVNNVIFHPNCQNIITSSLDSQIRIWSFPESQTTQIVRAHEIAVTSISLHATGDYLLSTSNDENWAFSDINTGKVLVKDGDNSSNHTLTTSKFHPDGLIFGTGTSDSLIKIWDLKDRSNVANFPGHNGAITAMSFSENGYYLATSAEDPVIKLWDLRKLKNFKTIPLDEGYQIKDLYFDYSGTYLAVAGTDVRVYISKQWEHIKTFEDHTALATNVRFGQNASYICSVSLDRSLKIYSN
ncbi:beta-arrestin-1 [Sarcoptes scabiei]|uniref:Pre-mRNA-processing factor 19 n=1 Tax=Sarcoptes scabiei TaxID=52283 RepID=A0A132AHY8_SARSC|nr:pre-mRNA-processing factor 19-like protein [Sarcoptes scabiei]UXI20380.1 beta-arrestin-1 [Sarcoptes scabiei]